MQTGGCYASIRRVKFIKILRRGQKQQLGGAMRIASALFLSVISLLWPIDVFADTGDLQIMEYACARRIADRMPVGIISCSDFFLPGPAYLWTKLRGDAVSLQRLKTGETLRIQHKWTRETGFEFKVETKQATEEDFPAGGVPPSLIEALGTEFETRGFFDWRTWTSKEKLGVHTYSIEVQDKNFKPIKCVTDINLPCPIKLNIGEAR